MKSFIILNTNIFKDYKLLKSFDKIYLIEDPYYINKNSHKQKLVIYISSLRYHYNYLSRKLKDVKIEYIPFNDYTKVEKIFKQSTEVHLYDPIDKSLIKNYSSKKTTFHYSPLFLETNDDLLDYKNNFTKSTSYNHASFYKWNRIRLNILMDGENPIGGRWNYDTENRKKFPKDYEEKQIKTYNNKYIKQAKEYVEKHFSKNFGLIDNIYNPVTHLDAQKHFQSFIDNKLNDFGDFEDAMSSGVIYGEHSNISILLNIGLLDVKYIISKTLSYYYNSKDKKKILPSVEGFIRQIIGWRSYMHFVYYFHKDDLQKGNYFGFNKKLPNSWYTGKTNLPILDKLIVKLEKYAYLHHIERLMIIGNLSILLEIHPKYVYKWFINCFIDSNSEWVMFGNTYGMLGHCQPNIKIMGRFYICSENYIKKMSNYKNDDLIGINDLYRNFLKKYKNKLKSDYSLGSQLARI